MRSQISEKTKRLANSAIESISETAQQIYKETLGIKDSVVSMAPSIRKYIYPSNPFDNSVLILTAIPSAVYIITQSDAPIEAIKTGLITYALLTPIRINEYK